MSTRREFISSFFQSLALLPLYRLNTPLSPDPPLPLAPHKLPEENLSTEELLKHLGLDERTVLRASHLPLQAGNRHFYLDGVDFQAFQPRLGPMENLKLTQTSPEHFSIKAESWDAGETTVFSQFPPPAQPRRNSTCDPEINFNSRCLPQNRRGQLITAEIPTVTSGDIWARHFIEYGYYIDNTVFTPVIQPYTNGEAFSTYLITGRFYDNKIVNALLAARNIAETMSLAPISPHGGSFSYLKAARIGELISGDEVLPGKAVSKTGNGFDIVLAGGICMSVTVIAKAVLQSQIYFDNIDKIRSRPHPPKYRYYENPSDPNPPTDATAYYDQDPARSNDYSFINQGKDPLYVVLRVQLIMDENIKPGPYDSLNVSTAYLIVSATLRRTPVTVEEDQHIKDTLANFRKTRKL